MINLRVSHQQSLNANWVSITSSVAPSGETLYFGVYDDDTTTSGSIKFEYVKE